MRRKIIPFLTALCLCGCLFSMCGCKQNKGAKEPDFSNARAVAELATYKVYTHNVARHTSKVLFLDRRSWFEYDAIVTYGIDANKLEIGHPHKVGTRTVVTVKMPQPQVFGRPDLQEETIQLVAENKPIAFLPDLSISEKNKAISNAQDDLEKAAKADTVMLKQARSRAEDLITGYVQNVGKAIGEDYKVEFEDVK